MGIYGLWDLNNMYIFSFFIVLKLVQYISAAQKYEERNSTVCIH